MKDNMFNNLKCPFCDEIFENIDDYIAHLKRHSDEERAKKDKEAAEKRNAEKQMARDNLAKLRAELSAAQKKYDEALAKYKEDYPVTYGPSKVVDLFDLFPLFF